MPSNAINPNNYNIDNFDSGILGPITDNNFRDFLLGHNLKDVNPVINTALGGVLISEDRGKEYNIGTGAFNVTDVPDLQTVAVTPSLYNNLTSPLPDGIAKNPTETDLSTWHPDYSFIFSQGFPSQGTSYGVPQALKLGFAGNVEEWVNEGGYTSTVHEIRDLKMFARENNKYGPAEIVAYNDPDNPGVNTGFIQYNDKIQLDFRETYLNRTLGVGSIPFSTLSSGINYKPDGQNISELDSIARKRRGDEVKNRIKLNFVDNTVGAINTSPFGLLAGGNLIERNYTITVPKTKLGKAAEFAAKLAGFNLPTSIIPQEAFGGYGVDPKDVDITNDLLDYTGGGQKSLLYDALYINKYGPNLESSNNPISNATVKKNLAGAGQPPTTENYLTYTSPPADTRKTSVIEDINNKVKNVLKPSKTPQKPEPDFSGTDPIAINGSYGFDTLLNKSTDTWSKKGNNSLFGASIGNDASSIGTQLPIDAIVPDINPPLDDGMFWGERTVNPFKKGILKYTQDLVNNSIATKNGAGRYIGVINNSTNLDAQTGKHTEYSNGNTTLTEEGDTYCRSWSVRNPYKNFGDLIRSEKNWWRVSDKKTQDLMTLTETGMPKIAWDSGDNKKYEEFVKTEKFLEDVKAGSIKGLLVPYMLSIENLAWIDAPQFNYLPNCEKGPNGGRIMWFPPYNLDFSDNTSIAWDSTTMVGRGEPIYTYNHTERSGSLSFSIVVDHPSVLNQLKRDFAAKFTDDFVHTYFGGCSNIKELFKDYLPDRAEAPKTTPDAVTPNQPVTPKTPQSPPLQNVAIYFPNAKTDDVCPGSNKDGKCTTPNTTQLGRAIPDLTDPNGYEVTPNPGNCITGLNYQLEIDLDTLAKFLVSADGKNYTIKINGYCSGTAPSGYNTKLGNDRALATRDYLLTKMQDYELNQGGPPSLNGTGKNYPSETEIQNSKDRWVLTSNGESGAPADTQDEDWKFEAAIDPCNANGKNENSLNSKQSRKTNINLEYTPVFQANLLKSIQDEEKAKANAKSKEQQEIKDITNIIAGNFINECDYFMEMKHSNSFIYETMREKLDNFHPAFHAITPEGFNSRLTFLQQCTRQGPQLMDPTAPQNMVFGRPPVCVLKIGDFYHTKIIIDSINFTYDPIQWDLNPEGIGVQPMLVKVDMGFKFIGGSSLGGPIKQLQNAVSYNFFANTGVYRPFIKIDNYLQSKRGFIYGSFLTPEDANNAYSEIQADYNKDILTSANNDVSGAKPTTETQQKTNEGQNVDTTNSTSGSNNPPTPAIKGTKLNDVLYEANYSGNNFKIDSKIGPSATVTSVTSPSPLGINIGNNTYIRFTDDGSWYKFVNGQSVSNGNYSGFGSHNNLIMLQKSPSPKTYSAPSLTLLLNQLI